MAGEPIPVTRKEVEKWPDSPHKQKVLAEMKKHDPPEQTQQSKPVQQPVKKSPPPPVQHKPEPKPKQKPKSRWDSIKERVLGRREERKEREHRGRVSSRSIYKDGKLVEKIHYGPAKAPAQPKPHRRRGDPLGGIGAGMSFNDMLPSNSGTGLGGMIQEPFTHPADQVPRARSRKGTRRRQPREPESQGFDYLDHINQGIPKPWREIKW